MDDVVAENLSKITANEQKKLKLVNIDHAEKKAQNSNAEQGCSW